MIYDYSAWVLAQEVITRKTKEIIEQEKNIKSCAGNKKEQKKLEKKQKSFYTELNKHIADNSNKGNADIHSTYNYFKAYQCQPDMLQSLWTKEIKNEESKEITAQAKDFFDYLKKPKIDNLILPPYSFMLQFRFTLESPYISKNENDFYIIDNPVRTDKVLRLPYVAPSSWKGCLRSALWQVGYDEDSSVIRRLFGSKKTSGKKLEEMCAGRLHFYPTFFTQKSLEVINPHSRKTGAGKNPIIIESVPAGTDGYFSLLYVPFDNIGKDPAFILREMKEDIKLIAIGLYNLFRTYGFGAKTSSGFGTAKEGIEEFKTFPAIKNTGLTEKLANDFQEQISRPLNSESFTTFSYMKDKLSDKLTTLFVDNRNGVSLDG